MKTGEVINANAPEDIILWDAVIRQFGLSARQDVRLIVACNRLERARHAISD